MRRVFTLLLLLIIPFQFAWPAGASLHGHMGSAIPLAGLHAHGHASGQDAGHDDHLTLPTHYGEAGHNGDEHHDSHCHPVFLSIFMQDSPYLGALPAGNPRPPSAAAFASRIPPLSDRPPSARA